MVVERTGAAGATSGRETPSGTESSASRPWDLELGYVSEPDLKTASGPTSAPEVWNSASPEPLVGDAKHRGGGAGFRGAVPLREGIWKDGISPGQTRFYKVPVDWGQQVYATADLGSASRERALSAPPSSCPSTTRYEASSTASAPGTTAASVPPRSPPASRRLREPLRPQRPRERMRFAGSYYLVVHLAAQVADRFGEGPFGLTMRVRVTGAAGAGPAYAGKPVPGDVFAVPVGGSDGATGDGTADGAAGIGESGGGTGRGGVMKLVAVGGIGTGTLLMLTLGMWTVIARRRAVRTVRPAPEDADTASASLPAPAPWEHGAARGR